MSEVTRYRFTFADGFSELSPDGLLIIPAEGEYVRAESIAELEAEVLRLRDAIEGAIEQFGGGEDIAERILHAALEATR